MQKLFFLPPAILLLIFTTYAQPVNFEWAIGIGGIQNDESRDLAVDDSGNVFITGIFTNSVDFDPGPALNMKTSAGASDIYVAKYTPSGELGWVKTYGTTAADYSSTMLINDSSQIYVIGMLGPGIIIKKLTASGGPIWTKTIAGTGFKVCTTAILDKSNNLLISGYFQGTVDFDPNIGTANLISTGTAANDAFVLKFSSSGNLTWARSFGGNDDVRITSMAVDKNDNTFLTGFFYGTIDFDPSSGVVSRTSAGVEDIFLMKMDDTGNLIWVKTIGGNQDDIATGIAVDSTGNSYLTGEFNGTVDFNPGPGVSNLSSQLAPDAFFCKFNSTGNLQWAKGIGGSFTDWGLGVALDDSANVYSTGLYEFNNVDFDPGPGTFLMSTAGLIDAFVLKLTTSGDFKWAQSMGGAMEEMGTAIVLDKYRNIYTTGTNKGSGDYNPFSPVFTLGNNGWQDIFLQRLSQCRDRYDTLQIVSCSPVTSPSGNSTWNISGTYHDTINNPTGCDSIFTVQLTIDTVNTGIILNGHQLTANQSAATYQWLNCDSNYAFINSATNQNFSPTANGNYAVAITTNGCTDTSACFNINDIGLGEEIWDEGILIYPNPSTGRFTVKMEESNLTSVLSLYNTQGSLIWSRTFKPTKELRFSIDGPPGLYFLKVDLTGKKSIFTPLIKN